MNSDDLDNQIRLALGGEPNAAQLARLQAFWATQSRADRVRRMWRRVAAAAASITAVAGLWWAGDRSKTPDLSSPEIVVAAAPTIDDGVPSTQVVESAPTVGREPTAYERMMFAVQTAAQTTPVQALAARLNQATTGDEKRRVIEILADNGSHEALAALLRAAEQSVMRGDALVAVERVVGVDRLSEYVPLTRDPAVRSALLVRLLATGSPVALHSFLTLAASPATRGEALAAAAAAPQLPIAGLVEALDAADKSERLAAALVLGHVNGPTVSAALIARVSESERAPVEAWVALLACRGAAVDRFLTAAQQQPRTLGQVNNARMYWARIAP